VAATAGAFAIWGLIPLYWKLIADLPATEILAHRIAWSLPWLALLLALRRRGRELRRVLGSPRARGILLASTLLITANWLTFRHGLPWVSLVLAFSFGLYGLLRKVVDAPPMVGLFVEVGLLAPLAAGYLVWLRANGEGAFATGNTSTSLLLAAAGPVTVGPLLLFAEGLRKLTLATVGFLQYMAPTGHFILAVTVFAEPFDAAHLAAFACIWTALALYTFDLRRRLGQAPHGAPR
jgi:chloramphenicol-sensitive protein RarD